jgi:hypothetical protein
VFGLVRNLLKWSTAKQVASFVGRFETPGGIRHRGKATYGQLAHGSSAYPVPPADKCKREYSPDEATNHPKW